MKFSVYGYLIFFFFIFFLGIVLVSFFRFSFFFLSNTTDREVFITILIFVAFVFRNKLILGKFRPIVALTEMVPILPIYFYMKGKMFDLEPVADSPERLFRMSIILSLFMFMLILILSILSLTFKPLFITITNTSTTGGFVVPTSIPQNYAGYIITHNLSFLFYMFAGSIFLFFPTFAENYVSSLIIMPPLGGALLTGNSGYILPNGVLEITGIIVASATGFVFMTTVYEMIKRGRNFRESFYGNSNYMRIIVVGLSVSFLLFIFAWPLEYTLIRALKTGTVLTPLWFRYAYLTDVYLIIVTFILVGKASKGKLVSPLEFFNLFFFIGLFVFIIVASSFDLFRYVVYEGVLAVISLFFLLRILFDLLRGELQSGHLSSQLLPDSLGENASLLYARGKSMLPSITSGDILIVYKGHNSIEVGDIITYQAKAVHFPLNPQGMVTHRVVSVSNDMIRTKGDNMQKEDPPIAKKQVVGQVIARYSSTTRREGYFEVLNQAYSEELKPLQNYFFGKLVSTAPAMTIFRGSGRSSSISILIAAIIFLVLFYI